MVKNYIKNLIFVLGLIVGNLYSQASTTDSLALVALYNSTGGSSWSHTWNLAEPVTEWEGVTLENGRVVVLKLVDNNLRGTLPPELGNLTELVDLQLRSANPFLATANKFSGSIPAELGNLSKLINLNLGRTGLSGSIPPEIGNLSNLKELYLLFNNLTGPLPREIGNLSNLIVFDIFDNEISGDIPEEFSQLTSMWHFSATRNSLTGSLKPFMGMLQLERLYLSENAFTDSIPESIDSLNKLQIIDISKNDLEGTVPEGLFNIISLMQINLSHNNFNGPVSDSIINLTKLNELIINDNSFDYLPNLSALPALTKLIVHNNNLGFGDILPNLNAASSSFQYSPQQPVSTDTSFVWGMGGNLTLNAPAFDGLATSYKWYKNNVSLLQVYTENGVWKTKGGSDTLNIRNVQLSDYGTYRVEASNSTIGPLQLSSGNISVWMTDNVAPEWGENPDFTAIEDDTTIVKLFAHDLYNDSLTFTATTDTAVVEALVFGSNMFLVPTMPFRGYSKIFISVTDGEYSLFDTLDATFNSPPDLEPVADIEMNEDTEYELVVNVTDTDTLAIQVFSTGTHLTVDSMGTHWLVKPSENWSGSENLVIIVSDSLTTITDTVSVTVNPIPDMPGSFELLTPGVDSVLTITPEIFGDTVKFTWTTSLNVDATPLMYNIGWQSTVDNSYMWVGTYEDTVGGFIIDSAWVYEMRDAGFTEISGTWNVTSIVSPNYIMALNGDRLFTLRIPATLEVENFDNMPDSFELGQNYPNPFNPTTTIRYQLPEATDVSIKIYNIMGREVKALVNQYLDAGYKEVVWDATDNHGERVSGGMYFYQIKAGSFQKTRKMLLLK